MTAPRFRDVLLGGLPGFLREGFLPLLGFYAGLRLWGLLGGIALATVASLGVYALERRAGRDGLLVQLSLAFVVVQGATALAFHSTTLYLAQPIVATAVWALAFLISVPLGRPLAGLAACAWYPFPRDFRATPEFRRVFGVESIVWGVYLLARSGLRLVALGAAHLEVFLVVTFATGIPCTFVLVVWSIRYALRELTEDDRPAPPPRALGLAS
jgi:intracellular septation protein A